ncbi:BioH protein [Stenotrophomonas maltophilia]|nr:BioH protein [Stenotrophomonas maltophilia]
MGIRGEEKPDCDSGSAAPQDVLMLPGLDGSGCLSTPFLSALQAHGLTTQAITLPAQGGQDHATLAQRLWSQLPGHPFILLAESFSGPLAIELAARQPSGLRGLVLAATFARRPVPLPAASAALMSPAWPLPPVALLARLLLGRWRTREHLSMLRDALARVPAITLRQRPQRPCGSTYAHCCRQSKCRRCACTRAMTACCGHPAWPSCRPCCPRRAMCRWRRHTCCCRRAPTQLQPKSPRG